MKYNDTIIINCTIFNITEKNPFYEGFEYGNTTDKTRFMIYDFEANNFLKANTILPNKSIITESNKSKIICQIPDENENKEENLTKFNKIFYKKNSSKLSTGVIIGIIIPCVVILLIAIFATFRKQPVDFQKTPNSTLDLRYDIKDFYKQQVID